MFNELLKEKSGSLIPENTDKIKIAGDFIQKDDENDIVLISEGCTHHRQCNDIGTAIAYMNGILERSLEIIHEIKKILD